MKEIIKKLRKYEIEIRKTVTSNMQGDFHSIFKGSGLEFDDVRSYQYGDDVRTIDWNVSAKGHGTFVKTFKEEKEQTVYFLLDVSASQNIGNQGNQKIDIGKEICGVLTLSAIKESSQVGLICFSDQKERHLKPGKGTKHAYHVIHELFNLNPISLKTDLSKAMVYAMKTIKKRSVIVFVSDFIDDNYMHHFRALAKKHDVVAIHLSDKRETQLPNLGISPVYDKESNKTLWVNTSSKIFRSKLQSTFSNNADELLKLCRKYRAAYAAINTSENYVPTLIKLFKIRNKSKKSA